MNHIGDATIPEAIENFRKALNAACAAIPEV